ncbi:UspA domain protein [Luminiphilus syltensis NOR5-1B]|uniref:UspA domain protein n=1 Tax=Luminiphilus syltensis NOR5-1B TaxID=565045 RepID=B8KRJ8_9GAMM|nr:universal stress protein [Luminiphilus syltensis]EED34969.1 UspA domain protein [Luminiphilus syltensis NOR5-1B]
MNKVLIVADIEDKCSATPRGLSLAREMDLQPEVVAFAWVDLSKLALNEATSAEAKKKIIAERRAAVEARVEKYAQGESVKVTVVWAKEIHDWICKRAENGYAAVVKTRHQTESIGHTPTDWHLLRECPAPVLLVGKKRWKKASTILATVDLNAKKKVKQQLNIDVILEARHFAEIFDAELKVLGVLEVPTLLADLDLVDPKTYADERKKEAQPIIDALVEATGVARSAFKLKRGPVAETIVSEASRLKTQLVVMGTVGRRGVKAKVIGNTAEEVLHLLKSDTLTLKP